MAAPWSPNLLTLAQEVASEAAANKSRPVEPVDRRIGRTGWESPYYLDREVFGEVLEAKVKVKKYQQSQTGA